MTSTEPSLLLQQVDYALQLFPEFAKIIQQPGIAGVLIQASQEKWPPARLEAAIWDTPYWKGTTDTQRKWDVMQATDPAQAKQVWDTSVQHSWDVLNRLGVGNLNVNQVNPIIAKAIHNGWDDRTLTGAVLNAMHGRPLPTTGDLKASMDTVQGMANDYAVTMSDQTAFHYAAQFAQGATDKAAVQAAMQQAAISRYGNNANLLDALNRGQTVRQFADPYVQTAAKELQIPPESIDLTQSKWNKFLDPVVDQSGKPVAMPVYQWQQTIRTDPQYGWDTTQTARDLGTQTAIGLAQHMGATA